MSSQQKPKLRIRFTENGKIRFVSHRDVARIVERALRIVRLPVAYSEGFSPRPKISFGLALSVAHESDAEYIDVTLGQTVDIEGLPLRLSEALPDGLEVTAVQHLEPGSGSLQQVITSCTWLLEVVGLSNDMVDQVVSEVLSASELVQTRVRKGKTSQVDVRPAILSIEVLDEPVDQTSKDGVQLKVDLATESLSLRPDEFVKLLGEEVTLGRVRRTHQWMTVDGVRCEPIQVPEPSKRRQKARAL